MVKTIKNILYNCPICGDDNCVSIIDSEDFFLSREQFSIVECSNCALRFTNPLPNPESLQKYYESPEYISHSNTKTGIISGLYYLVRNITLKGKVRLVCRFKISGNILDIGCGTGEFLQAIKRHGYDATGIEPNAKARDFTANQKRLSVFDENEIDNLPLHYYDIITMWHVFEHVYDLKLRIYQIQKLLKKDGILIIAVPNPDSWDARYYQEFWAAYDLPRHLYHFTQKSLTNLFNRNSFILVKTKPMIFDSFYISLLSEKYKTGKSSFFNAILKGLFSNFWAIFNQNNFSSMIYVFKNK